MAAIADARQLFDDWIAAVVTALRLAIARFAPRRDVRFVEGDGFTFTAPAALTRKGVVLPELTLRPGDNFSSSMVTAEWLTALHGSRIEFALKPERVLFRDLDFPKQAVDFLEGMIRSQIDRLTPWSASEVAFGFALNDDAPGDRLHLHLAATSRRMIEPLVKLAGNLGAQTVVASVTPPARENSSARIEILEATLPGAVGLAMDIPRVLRLMLLGAGLAAVAALALAAYADSAFDDEQQRLQHQITERRASLRLAQNGAGNSAQALLAKRKQTSASAVMVLEQVSRVLPDGTYVTELRIEGDKVQIVGLTQDAPSLIRLLEQSPQFTRATFFAPTTRTQNEAGERFHIEAHITPYFGPGS